MATTTDFRNGLCIEYQGGRYVLVSFQHVKPGKGGAFVRTKLKNIETGRVLDHTFTAGARIQTLRVERRPYQFLYKDPSGYHLMDTKNFEQIILSASLISGVDWMKEGQELEVMFDANEEKPLRAELPPFVSLLVEYTERGVKGDTATNTLKPAKVETGAEVQVPLFVEMGDVIKVDTRTGKYQERYKDK